MSIVLLVIIKIYVLGTIMRRWRYHPHIKARIGDRTIQIPINTTQATNQETTGCQPGTFTENTNLPTPNFAPIEVEGVYQFLALKYIWDTNYLISWNITLNVHHFKCFHIYVLNFGICIFVHYIMVQTFISHL